MNGNYVGIWFSVKCVMQDNPYLVVFYMMAGGIFIGGICLRILERPMTQFTGLDFSSFGNSAWTVILMMTTVGYGDYFPVSIYGRIMGFVLSIWGVIVVSIMVVTISNLLELETSEENALILLQRLTFKEQLRDNAAYLLGNAFRYRRLLNSDPDNVEALEIASEKFKKYMHEFQRLKIRQRNIYQLDSPEDRLERKVNKLLDESEERKPRLELINDRMERIYLQLIGSKYNG